MTANLEWQPVETFPPDDVQVRHLRGVWVMRARDKAWSWQVECGYIDQETGGFLNEDGEDLGWPAEAYDAWCPMPGNIPPKPKGWPPEATTFTSAEDITPAMISAAKASLLASPQAPHRPAEARKGTVESKWQFSGCGDGERRTYCAPFMIASASAINPAGARKACFISGNMAVFRVAPTEYDRVTITGFPEDRMTTMAWHDETTGIEGYLAKHGDALAGMLGEADVTWFDFEFTPVRSEWPPIIYDIDDTEGDE